MLVQFLQFIKEINQMPVQLDDVECFYNYKTYSVSIMRSGHPTLRLEAGEEVLDKNGEPVKNEWLLDCSLRNELGRKMKTTTDKMIKTEESAASTPQHDLEVVPSKQPEQPTEVSKEQPAEASKEQPETPKTVNKPQRKTLKKK